MSSGSSQDHGDSPSLLETGGGVHLQPTAADPTTNRNLKHRVSLELSRQYTELARKLSEVEGIQTAPPQVFLLHVFKSESATLLHYPREILNLFLPSAGRPGSGQSSSWGDN